MIDHQDDEAPGQPFGGYPKKPGPFKRNQDTKLIEPWNWSDQFIAELSDKTWYFTEKVDGTNIRIMWDGHNVTIGGRTARAQLPGRLRIHLEETYCTPEFEEILEQNYGAQPVMIVGEGYGSGIQSGGYYSDDQLFIGFAVAVGREGVTPVADPLYLPLPNALEAMDMLGVPNVEIVATGELEPFIVQMRQAEAGDYITDSKLAPGHQLEGYVAYPAVPFRNHWGEHVSVKLKWSNIQ